MGNIVWVAIEHNSGGAGVRGVYASLEAAEACIDKTAMGKVHEHEAGTIWSRKDKMLSVTISRQVVQDGPAQNEYGSAVEGE